MKKQEPSIIHEEKISIGPVWYLTVLFLIALSAFLIRQAPVATLPVVIGAVLILLVETFFSYPIRYYITDNSLVAKSGLILRHEITYSEIKEIETIKWYKLYFYVGGNRIVGMPKDKVIIINPKTDRMILTPGKETLDLILNKSQVKFNS